MIAAAVLITVTGILFGQSFLRILPLYISLMIGLLQSQVSRYAPLIGGFNSVLYALVYFYYGLYASAGYALLISGPLQIITFIRWKKKAYKHSTVFRSMTWKQRGLLTAACVSVWVVLYLILSAFGSSYRLLDNTTTLFGIVITVLTMLSFVEYTVLMIPSSLISIALYAVMIKDSPEQITYLIYSLYSFSCQCVAFVNARKLYREQQTLKAANEQKGEPS